jgi:hypothetical protein
VVPAVAADATGGGALEATVTPPSRGASGGVDPAEDAVGVPPTCEPEPAHPSENTHPAVAATQIVVVLITERG